MFSRQKMLGCDGTLSLNSPDSFCSACGKPGADARPDLKLERDTESSDGI
jgi:hypothetical protein